MPVHDDDDYAAQVFNDSYTLLMERAPEAPTLEEISLSPEQPHRRALLVQPRRWVWAAGAAVVVGLLIGGVAWFTSGSP